MPSPRSVIQSTTTEKSPRHLLRSLNLYGLDHLDPVILAVPAHVCAVAQGPAEPGSRPSSTNDHHEGGSI